MTEKNNFPPIHWLWRDYKHAAAWYSGDPMRLAMHGDGDKESFWQSKEKIKIHVPLAADIAAMSAGMIFATSPEITCEDERTNERIAEVMRDADIYSALLQAAELASAYGGVYLKWTWNAADRFPRLYVVPADMALAKFNGNQVREITFWNIVREEENTREVWRLEETYTPDGRIHNRLLKGDANNLGKEVGLNSIPETKGLKDDVNSGAGRMLAFYVPNILPNRARPYAPFGRSDYEGLYGLFDALDEAYSTIQRESRLTKTTVIVPAEYLRRRDSLFGDDQPKWVYSNESGVFTALDIDSDRTSAPITIVNPEIRAESRIAVCENIIRRILQLAGYSPQSSGMDIDGTAESGTALNIRERKSIRTTETKKTFWWHAVNDIICAMLALDAAVFKSGVDPNADFSVELPTGNQPDIAQLAQVVEQLERAEAVSIETKVNILHPEWDENMRAEEVERIKVQIGTNAQARMNTLMANINQNSEGDEE